MQEHSSPAADPPDATNFDRLNALVDRGWVSVLRPNELQLWLVLLKFADGKTGVAWPGSELVLKLLGHASNKNLSRIRSGLVAHGLLEVLPGGTLKRWNVRLPIPPHGSFPQIEGKTASLKMRESIGAPSIQGELLPQFRDFRNKDEQTIEQTIALAAQASAATAGAATAAAPGSVIAAIGCASAIGPTGGTGGLVTFECVGGKKSTDRTWSLTAAHAAELGAAFPGVDVRAEAMKAVAWTQAAPTNRKTAGGMKAFLFRWMTRCQDRGGASPNRFGNSGANRNGHSRPDTGPRIAIPEFGLPANRG